MPHLVVTSQDKLIGEYPITRERITIGRKPDNDVCINSLAISGYHTQIITVLNSSFLEDLNSTNGLFFGDKRFKRRQLRDGDVISLGEHELVYTDLREAQSSAGASHTDEDEKDPPRKKNKSA